MKNNVVKKVLSVAMVAALTVTLAACGGGAAEETTSDSGASAGAASGEAQFTIGYAQRGTDAAYTIAMMDQNLAYAEENYPEIEFLTNDAQNDAATQASNVEDLVAAGVDLILLSPHSAEGLTDACQAAMDAGIPVITMDREVNCDVTVKVVGDNYQMGVDAADKLAEMLEEEGNIIELCGTTGASATVDRQGGFEDTLAEKYPNMEIVDWQDCDYNAADAASYMEDMLQKYGPGEIQAIYAHNDQMALGAISALEGAGRLDEGILICGMDGEEAAYQAIEDGSMAFTIIYPTMAPQGVQAAYNILTGKDQEGEVVCPSTLVDADNIADYIGTGL